MSGLTAFLQTELLTLSSEARRKHPEIKEAAERLSVILRSFKERPGYSIANELAKTEDALRPFVLACETKQVKLVTIAIGCIQKLISFHAIPETSVRTILRTLTDISTHGVEIQLKILQTVLPLLNNYRSVHDDILAEALLICFRLQDSKIVVVNNTAAATLRQLVIFVFDKVAKEDSQQQAATDTTAEVEVSTGEKIHLRPCAKDAYYLFRDLCLLTNGDHPQYLRLNHLSKTFGLELIESVLSNHYKLFREHNELSSILKELVCPMFIKNFSEKSEFPQTMRLTRVVSILIKKFNEILVMECEIFLTMFVKILEPENPLWLRVLAMEIFKGVCSDAQLTTSIYKWYDGQNNSSTNVFRDMITGFGRLATEKPQSIGANQGGRDSFEYSGGSGGGGSGSAGYHLSAHSNQSPSSGLESGLSTANSTMRIQCIDQLDKTDPPAIPETYIFYLALVCLNSIADGLAGFALSNFSPGSVIKQKQEEKETKDVKVVTDMANVAWPGLLAAMSFYLTANLDEELFQSTMRSYQNFTNVCGVLDLVTPRDAFLTNLCKNSIPIIPLLSSGFISSTSNSATSKLLNSNMSSTSIGTVSSAVASVNQAAVAFADLPTQQQQALSNITLNDKNLYSLRVLLNITMFLSSVLGSSWYLVLETLQLADFLLFNRPTPKGSSTGPGGSGSAGTASANPATPITNNLRRTITGSSNTSASNQQTNNQMMDADHLTIISASFQRLFENSKYLDDDSFIAFSSALCRMSSEVSGTPFIDQASSLPTSNKASKAKIFNTRSFAIDKLEYIASLDMDRLINTQKESSSKIWDIIMTHLIATANYPLTPAPIRAQCCETISTIITIAMNHVLSEYNKVNESTQNRLLLALNQCINYTPPANEEALIQETLASNPKAFSEVQKMGLETLNNLLQTSGHSFTCGWGLILDMLRHVAVCAIGPPSPSADVDSQDDDDEEEAPVTSPEIKTNERASIDTTASSIMAGSIMAAAGPKSATGLIKVAFSSLQLICTDFLSLLSPDCLRQCIATLGSFGMQSDDLNISLTAVGLLWNLSDFIQTRRIDLGKESTQAEEKIDKDSINIDLTLSNEDESNPKTYSILWMLLLLQLSHTCIDWRPEVRNGANQTLFRTITMNGHVLGPHLWNACIWEVLFPLLDSIKMSSIRASKMSLSKASSPSVNDRDSSGFMLHHSRDTADKQWDETKVLILTGISSIFQDFLQDLHGLEHFQRAFTLLLAHLEDSCLRSSQEVSLASIKSFKTIVTIDPNFKDSAKLEDLWRRAWNTWQTIGRGISQSMEGEITYESSHSKNWLADDDAELQSLTLSLSSSSVAPISDDFTQDTLTSFVTLFTDLYKLISHNFTLEDVSSLLSVLRNVLVYSTSPQYRPDVDHVSPLQEAVLEAVQTLDMNTAGVPPLVLADLAEYMTLAFLSPPEDGQNKNRGYIPPSQRKFSTVTYIALNKKCNTLVSTLFQAHVTVVSLYTEGVFERIIGAYGLPMKLKYDCPPSFKHGDDKTPLWKLATTGLLEVLKPGLETLEAFGEDVSTERFCGVWRTLVDILEGSLLSPSSPPESMKIEELDVDEHFDISVLSVIQNDIVVHMGQPRVPLEVIEKLVSVIRESSRLYYIEDTHDRSSDIAGTTGTIVPVMKESFAYASFMTLFSLCSCEKQDFPEVRKRIAQVVIPVLLERCETILRNYTADEPLLGRCPFPRVRKEEMLFLLKQSIQLKLQENIMTLNDDSSSKFHMARKAK
ncbi:protein MON2 homolog isoform X3 [Mucor ambiguus]|uniref:Protein MON2 homolog isoform X3 n=1 Tax=Mucor ambiguus TaxID=91626 RepID=A0A0C9M139_9FUNG|nr:protein MON2 homolog isoform X3 [Mucor ambiguus]